MNTGKNSMIVILGPTATGKTRLACLVASRIGAEVISADSRQVYRGMDIGTGKDYKDYLVGAQQIPNHLIDIAEPGTEYNVYQYQKDFIKAYRSINERNKRVILCGGTGMYLEAVLKGYQLLKVPVNQKLRVSLEPESNHQLSALLQSSKKLHNITDTSDRKRLIRAIEIQHYYRNHPELMEDFPKIDCQIFGVHFPREIIRERITSRLKIRLGSGMIDEVKGLIDSGIEQERLKFYGLEYKYVTQYLLDELTYEEMLRLLNTAIHQFAKRQITWFRRMEKSGIKINWLDGANIENNINHIINRTL